MFTDYQVVEAATSSRLTDLVRGFLAAGWQPYGPMEVNKAGDLLQPMTEGQAQGSVSEIADVVAYTAAMASFATWADTFVTKLDADITGPITVYAFGDTDIADWIAGLGAELNADAGVTDTDYATTYTDVANLGDLDDLDEIRISLRALAAYSVVLVAKLNADVLVTDTDYAAWSNPW